MAKETKNEINKHDIVKGVSESTSLRYELVEDVYDSIMDTALDALWNGSDVVFNRIAKFELVDRPAHEGRNPSTGETIMVGDRRVVKIRPRSDIYRVIADIDENGNPIRDEDVHPTVAAHAERNERRKEREAELDAQRKEREAERAAAREEKRKQRETELEEKRKQREAEREAKRKARKEEQDAKRKAREEARLEKKQRELEKKEQKNIDKMIEQTKRQRDMLAKQLESLKAKKEKLDVNA